MSSLYLLCLLTFIHEFNGQRTTIYSNEFSNSNEWLQSQDTVTFESSCGLGGNQCVKIQAGGIIATAITTTGYRSIEITIDARAEGLASNENCLFRYGAAPGQIEVIVGTGTFSKKEDFLIDIPDTSTYNDQSSFPIQFGHSGSSPSPFKICLYDDLKVTAIPNTPTTEPSNHPSKIPTVSPTTKGPSRSPSMSPSESPSKDPTESPTTKPPTDSPTSYPSTSPSETPSKQPSNMPSKSPSEFPSVSPSDVPSKSPSKSPTSDPSSSPSNNPTSTPSTSPIVPGSPTRAPLTPGPTVNPTRTPTTKNPTSTTISPTPSPTLLPSVQASEAKTANTTSAEIHLSPEKETGSDLWIIVGAVIGGVVLIAIIVIIVWKCRRKPESALGTLGTSSGEVKHTAVISLSTIAGKSVDSDFDSGMTPMGEIAGRDTNDNDNNDSEENSMDKMYDKGDARTKGNNVENENIEESSDSDQMFITGATTNGNHGLDTRNYKQWTHDEILQWILTLDNGLFMRYRDILQKSLSEENVKGIHLKRVNYELIKSWGVKDFEHKEILKNHISMLLNSDSGEGGHL